jgi:flagellar basal-body rod modification protein FlgD
VTADAQDRFLKLLTTQLKNQDPLNPMDNAQMTSQLAQISTVDGIEKLNATLQKLLSSSNEPRPCRPRRWSGTR